MKVIYIHHGQRLNKNDDMTNLGVQDCNLIAEILNQKHIKDSVKAIYTSNHLRCKKTAEYINKYFQVDMIEDERLNEFGSIENESWIDAQKRIMNCLDQIVKKYGKEDAVVCVTSGVNIAGFICKAFGAKPTENTPFLGVPSCSPIIFNYND